MDEKQLQAFKVGKTKEQLKVIDYFTKTGCLNFSGMKDEEYEALVKAKRDSLRLREQALAKIGLDEDQVSEIAPVCLEGYLFEKAFAKRTAAGAWVSSHYQVAWVFFSATQIYVYRHQFNMDESKKEESTDEFFYKDVTSLSTSTRTEEARALGTSTVQVETKRFVMVVPGDKITVAMEGVDDAEAIIQAMKQKLREKKS